MLHLMLGRAGFGKTSCIHQELASRVKEDEQRLMLLVPEQFSFESERALLALLGPKLAQTVQVVSFTRLAQRLLQQEGVSSSKRLNDSGRAMLMSLALSQAQDHLTVYRPQAQTPGMIQSMLSASAEFKMCGISPDQLGAVSHSLSGPLGSKIADLSAVLSLYDALVSQSYVDPMDDLTHFARLLSQKPLLQGWQIFLDGFNGFTGQEWLVIRRMMEQASDLWVTLCTDRLDDPDNGSGLFSPVSETGRSLRRMAKEAEIPVASPVYLNEAVRFASPCLKELEENIFRYDSLPCESRPSAIVLYEAADPFDEADFVARSIHRLIREQGLRYKNIAVIARSIDPYLGILDEALHRYGIPCFADRRVEVETKPLPQAVLSALEAVSSRWDTGAVLRACKTGFMGLGTEDIAKLENYVLLWKISGSRWTSPWHGNPRGFVEQETEEDILALEAINGLRERVMAPLLSLEQGLTGTGAQMAQAVWHFLEDVAAPDTLRAMVQQLESRGEHDLADQLNRSWDSVVGLLDQAVDTLSNADMTPSRFRELLQLALSTCDLGHIPQGLDQVSLGSADRMRPADVKVAFLVGANEGEFPASNASSGLLGDSERKQLIAYGLPLSDTAQQRACEEQFLAYTSLFVPSHQLYVSYTRQNFSGENTLPSSLFSEIRRCFPSLRIQTTPQELEELIEAEVPAFDQCASHLKDNTPKAASLRAYFSASPQWSDRMSALFRAADASPIAFSHPEGARALFGGSMRLSATRIEQYHLCRFAYFCKYGLSANVRRPAEVDALEYGSMTHFLLEHLLSRFDSSSWEALSTSEQLSCIEELADQYVCTRLGGWEDKSPRFKALLRRFTHSCLALAQHLFREQEQSSFVPVDFELAVGRDGDVKPFTLLLPGGERIQVEGKIDRVDIMQKDGISYVRVVDYKTGVKKFRLSDILYGLNMQMLLYLIALWRDNSKYGSVVPAGILYMPALESAVELDRHADSKALALKKTAGFKMNGLVLDDPTVVQGMEPGAKGIFIPVKALKNGGFDARSSLTSLAQLGHIEKHIRRILTQMAQSLQNGDIAALPIQGSGIDACQYCPYHAVCGWEKGDASRPFQTMKNDQVFETILREKGGTSHE